MTGIVKVDEIQNNAGTTTLAKIENDQLTGVLSPATGFRNRIINGDMRIDQRNNGASVTADNTFLVDRFGQRQVGGGVLSYQQSSTAPAGFVNSLSVTVATADASIAASDNYHLFHRIEGFNTADLGFGSASAKSVTLSFWVRSSLTGTFGGSLQNSAANRSYVFQYTITTANTFEYKTIIIDGDTSGTWLTTTGQGVAVIYDMGSGTNFEGTANAWNAANNRRAAGNVQLVSTSGATFFVTGVQLEKGTVAKPFEFRSIGQELGLCQRYFERFSADSTTNFAHFSLGQVKSSVNSRQAFFFKVTKRSLPTFSSSAASTFILDPSPGGITLTALGLDRATTNTASLSTNVASSTMSAQNAVRMLQNNTSSCHLDFISEL